MADEIRAFWARQVTKKRKKAKLSQAALPRLTNGSIARISEIKGAVANCVKGYSQDDGNVIYLIGSRCDEDAQSTPLLQGPGLAPWPLCVLVP